MTLSTPLIVFVDGTRVEVPRAQSEPTALNAVRCGTPNAARDVEQGVTLVTDGRGLPIPPDTPMHSGAILRLVPVRDHSAAAARLQSDFDPLP